MLKKTTLRISVVTSRSEELKAQFKGWELYPDVVGYLTTCLSQHKGDHDIYIPSSHNDAAVVLIRASDFNETLEMFDELHVYYEGRVIIEKWRMWGKEGISVPCELFSFPGIKKVSISGSEVSVRLGSNACMDSNNEFVRCFDFSTYDGENVISEINHPSLGVVQ